MHQVSLYVNGFDDLRTTIKFYTPFENSQILIGQYRGVEPFNGLVNNMTLYFYPANDDEIRNMR
jgi:hypothetical protein